jgi:hypothetical protein
MSNVSSTVRAKIVTATTPTIYNVSIPLANTEYSQVLNDAVKKLLIRARNKAQLKFSFVSGNTNSLYITIEPGAVFFEENLDLSNATLYIQGSTAGNVVEILEWT